MTDQVEDGVTQSVFISWEPSNSRSTALSRAFSAECVNIHYLSLKRPLVAPLKYVLQGFKTWSVLSRRRPELVFVQNPPVFAPLAVRLYCAFGRARFIIDSHTGAFLERKWKWLSPLHRYVARKAEVNIVTNDHLGGIVGDWGGDYYVFADVPIEIRNAGRIERAERFVTVVNSFSYDEPLAEVLEAAARLPDVSFAITGDVRRCPPQLLNHAPENVRFTGFVSRQEYIDTLNSSDAAVVLTREDHTMQRGAYEAMALGVPIVTSDWPLLRETFYKGTCYTDNTVASIERGIRDVLEDNESYGRAVTELRAERKAMWHDRLSTFLQKYLHDGGAR